LFRQKCPKPFLPVRDPSGDFATRPNYMARKLAALRQSEPKSRICSRGEVAPNAGEGSNIFHAGFRPTRRGLLRPCSGQAFVSAIVPKTNFACAWPCGKSCGETKLPGSETHCAQTVRARASNLVSRRSRAQRKRRIKYSSL
jgi:hypothetical protein